MKQTICFLFGFFLLCPAYGQDKQQLRQYTNTTEQSAELAGIISAVGHGIRNDGTPIGPELNRLIKQSYGKTVFFPAGTYNLTEPIVLPMDYTKNVNLAFDKNALLKSDTHLDALIKVGYSEVYFVDVTHRRFSYIEGGILDCYNADNGILIDGRKQLVQIRNMSLVRGRNTHIHIHLPEPGGTGSSDTKIDNVTIQGISSNDDVYGIYIDKSCCDCKISDTFIYGTKEAIVTKSAGHILNNVHLLAMNTSGGTVRADGENFKETVGIRISTGGFFVFNQVYYDTMDRGIVVDDNFSPDLLLDQQISYSYLNDFGTCFLHAGANSPNLRVKISNSTFTLRNKDYKLLDYSPGMVGWDIADKFSFVNCVVDGLHNLSPYDLTLLQRLRGKAADGLMWNRLDDSGSQWYVLGAVVASPLQNFLEIDLTDEMRAKLRFGFKGNGLNVYSYEFEGNDDRQVELGYALHGDFCVWMFRSRKGGSFTPVVYDLLGSGQFMPFPNKGKIYVPADYGVSEADIQVLDHP